jgi:monoterpene epsilon-lactone hydrolase
MASKESEALNRLYRDWVAALQTNPEMPLDELRRLFERWGDITGEPGGVDYIETDADGVPALWAVPKGCVEDRVLLCAHGGGYVVGSMYTHRKLYAHVAKAIGCRALIVHYGRAPENIHPGPVNDMARSYKWLLNQGIRPDHMALIGDSAGGGLAVTTLLRARELALPMPAATMPMSPWLDVEATGETFETNAAKDLLVNRDIIRAMAGTFLGENGNPHDPLANPLKARPQGIAADVYPGRGRRNAARRQPPPRRSGTPIRGQCDAGDRAGDAARLRVPGGHRARRRCGGSPPR